MTHYNYSLTELDNMMPWEREIYVTMLSQWIKEENERQEVFNKTRKNVIQLCSRYPIYDEAF